MVLTWSEPSWHVMILCAMESIAACINALERLIAPLGRELCINVRSRDGQSVDKRALLRDNAECSSCTYPIQAD